MAPLTPGASAVHQPAPAGVTPGSGDIMWPPVSVCHQVSTIRKRPPPMLLWYQIHASGLIGSPTVPSRRRLERSTFLGCAFGSTSEALISARIAVGAV